MRAPTGSGKSTRVPLHLLESGVPGTIWVVQPRRLAARSLAEWVARQIGESPGGKVGYQVRFDRKIGPQTRIVFLTPGVALRQWSHAETRNSLSAVLLDEFHERNAETDALAALVLEHRSRVRSGPALWLLSATIDLESWSHWLAGHGAAEVLESHGRLYPVEISHRQASPGTSIADAMAEAILWQLRSGPSGDLLCFVPGVGEIRRVTDLLSRQRLPSSVKVLPLHGDLEPDEQDAALRPATPGSINVVVATNVAETSLTLPGVRHVLDSGYVRSARFDPRRGLDTLHTVRASQRSADQRAGRAGRVAAGTCLRLWSAADIPPLDEPPEILRVDLSNLWLQLRIHGVPTELPWPTPPDPDRVASAEALLRQLHALDGNGRVTEAGREIARMPVSPRTGRVILESRRWGGARNVAAWAAEWESDGRDSFRLRKSLEDLLAGAPGRDVPLGRLLIAGFSDRIAVRTESDRWRLADGRAAEGAAEGQMGLALEVQETSQAGKGTALRLRSFEPLQPEWLDQAFPGEVERSVEVEWDPRARRVLGREVARLFGQEIWARPVDDNRIPRMVAEQKLANLVASGDIRWKLGEDESDWLHRARLVAKAFPEKDLCAFSEDDMDLVRATLVEGCLAAAGVENREVLPYLKEIQGSDQVSFVERMAPRNTTLASGRKARIEYQADGTALVAARIGDFVGVKQESIRIGQGRIPMVFEILAPNHRPVQRTSDLDGFWQRSYPAIKADLKRRYPRHPWP